MDLEKLKFPIGKLLPNKQPKTEEIKQWINEIEKLPLELEEVLNGLSIEELNWKYRPDGWSIKQVVHHCADSHINSWIRFKLALTENTPTIRPYFEDRWAELPDSLDDDISDSILLLKVLHKKWAKLLRTLDKKSLQREFIHPESGNNYNLGENIGIYAWHGNHHLAHIKNALAFEGKFN